MISFGVIGDLSNARARLAHWASIDMLPLANKIAEVIKLDNELSVGMDGIDANGAPLDPILPSTWERGRGGGPKGRGGQGFGPPLAPRFRSSRIVSGFVVTIEADQSGYLVIAGWPGLDWVRYHQEGFTVHAKSGDKFIEPRMVAGIRPSMEGVVQDAVTKFIEDIVGGGQ